VNALERLRSAVGGLHVDPGEGGPVLQVTASFGVAALDPALTVEESIDRADKAMYQAKTLGRNRIEVSAP
jgi:diguanylate cyclase (GGDEF)-like protein